MGVLVRLWFEAWNCDGGGFVWPFVTFSFCGCG